MISMSFFVLIQTEMTCPRFFCEKMRNAVDICEKRVYSKSIMKTISVNNSIRFYGFFWRFTA